MSNGQAKAAGGHSTQPDGIGETRIDLVAIDLDGTLLTTEKTITLDTREAVRQAVALGVRVVLASARPPRSVKGFYRQLGLDTLQINYNGAVIYDQPQSRHTFHQPIDPGLAERIIRFARERDPDVVVSVEILDKWYTDRVDDSLPTEVSKAFAPDHVGPLETLVPAPVTKIMFLAHPPRMGTLRRAIEEHFNDGVAVVTTDDHMAQVVHHRVDKADALRRIADHYGVARARTLAIGDAPNDVGMIRWAGIGVAVANAWEHVREAADDLAPCNDEGGVARALHRHVLNERD